MCPPRPLSGTHGPFVCRAGRGGLCPLLPSAHLPFAPAPHPFPAWADAECVSRPSRFILSRPCCTVIRLLPGGYRRFLRRPLWLFCFRSKSPWQCVSQDCTRPRPSAPSGQGEGAPHRVAARRLPAACFPCGAFATPGALGVPCPLVWPRQNNASWRKYEPA